MQAANSFLTSGTTTVDGNSGAERSGRLTEGFQATAPVRSREHPRPRLESPREGEWKGAKARFWKSVARKRELCFDLDPVCRSLVQPRILDVVGCVFSR